MKAISEIEYRSLTEGAALLEFDRRGPKVYATPDDRIVKLFCRKRLLSSSLWSPPAARFAKNARLLEKAGLHSPPILEVAKVPHLDRQMVIYRKIPGTPLRHFLRDAPPADAADQVRLAGAFVDRVQSLGVFFRSFHFGNVLVTPDGDFALIDVLDVWVKRRPLGLRLRQRNLKHLTRYQVDRAALFQHWSEFRDGYLASAHEGKSNLTASGLERILDAHRSQFPKIISAASS